MEQHFQMRNGCDLRPTHLRNASTGFASIPFRFLDLPSEIRNHVYTTLLVEKQKRTFVGAVIVKSLDQSYGRGYRSNKALEVQIFLVSRQLYTEASAIFYSKNMFTGTRLDAVAPFLRDRPDYVQAQIRSVSVPLDTDFDILREKKWSLQHNKFRDLCLLLSDRNCFPNLAQLDLCTQSIGIHTQLPQSAVKALSFIADPTIVTISNRLWFYPSGGFLFKPLRDLEEIYMEILRFRSAQGAGISALHCTYAHEFFSSVGQITNN